MNSEELERIAQRMGQLEAERGQLDEGLTALSREEEEFRLGAATAEAEQSRVEGSRLDLGRLEADLAQVRETLATARTGHEQAH